MAKWKRDSESYVELMKMYRSGDKKLREYAFGELLRLEEWYLQNLVRSKPEHKYYFEDMMQVARIAFVRCLERYDAERAVPTTFISKYVLEDLNEFVAEFAHGTSLHYYKHIAKINAAEKELTSRGITPTILDLANHTGISKETIARCLTLRNYGVAAELDEKIKDNTIMGPEESAIEAEQEETIQEALKILTEEERTVILWRFGFMDGNEHKKDSDLRKCTGIPEHRIKPLINRALKKLKEKSQLSGLRVDHVRKVRKSSAGDDDISVMPKNFDQFLTEIQELDADVFEEIIV